VGGLGRRAPPCRAWRDTVDVHELEGRAQLHTGSSALDAFSLRSRFTAKREQLPIEGEIAVNGGLKDPGAVPAITMPDAEPVPTRQRTILDERALLGGLGAAASKGAP
jgi:hypothetical protein